MNLPDLISAQGPETVKIYQAFFIEKITNENTRDAYLVAVQRFFHWCENRCDDLHGITKKDVSDYVSVHPGSTRTIKQHLSAVRKLFEWLEAGGVLNDNPATGIKIPQRLDNTRPKTPLTAGEARHLLDSIDVSHLVGLRDRALIGVLIFSLSKISTALTLKRKDFLERDGIYYLRFPKKGGRHLVPVHHLELEYLRTYIDAAGEDWLDEDYLFRSSDRSRRRNKLLKQSMTRKGALKMLKRRIKEASLSSTIDSRSLRGTGIVEYLRGGGDIETAARIAGDSPSSIENYINLHVPVGHLEVNRIEI